MIFYNAAAIALIAVGLSQSPALAQQEPDTATIRYADLDLLTLAGRKILDHRIADALQRVCGSIAGLSAKASAAEWEEIVKCRTVNRELVNRRVAERTTVNDRAASAR